MSKSVQMLSMRCAGDNIRDLVRMTLTDRFGGKEESVAFGVSVEGGSHGRKIGRAVQRVGVGEIRGKCRACWKECGRIEGSVYDQG